MANQQYNDKVVGVFLDQAQAQKAIQELNAMGCNAQVADKSALKAFRDAGWEDEVVSTYEGRMNQGNSIVTASGGRGEDIMGTFLQNGAEYVNLKESSQGMQGMAGAQTTQTTQTNKQNMDAKQRDHGQMDTEKGRHNADEAQKVQLREETLTPVKQNVQAGEVELHKVVHERQQEVPVTLTHEEVYVERHAVDRPATSGDITDMQDEVIRVPVYEEQAELQKQTRVREEVNIGKKAVQEQQTLAGTARHEHVEVVPTGGVQVVGDTGMQTDRMNQKDQMNQTNKTNK